MIRVRGGDDVSAELVFTRHGPVIHETDDKVFAVRAGWLEPGMAPYFGSVEYMRASNWREFEAALNRWGAPSENQVYADIDGNIGYKPGRIIPASTELGRSPARPRRRPLRMDRLFRYGRAAGRVQPAARIYRQR